MDNNKNTIYIQLNGTAFIIDNNSMLYLGLGKAASVAFGRQGELGWGSRYWPRFFLDGDETSVVTSSEVQVIMVTGTRSRFTRTSYLLKVQVETYKMQSRTWERLTSCIVGTKIQGQG